MKRIILVLGLIMAILAALFAYDPSIFSRWRWSNGINKNLKLIPVLQVIDADLVNDIRNTTALYLKDCCNISIYHRISGNKINEARKAAREVLLNKPPIVLAIGTTSALALMEEIKERRLETVLVFSNITDPVKSGIIDSMDEGRVDFATGTSDKIDSEHVIYFASQLIPNMKKIGYIHNPLENNSIVQYNELLVAAQMVGAKIVLANVNEIHNIPDALQGIVGDVDFVMVGGSNISLAGIDKVIAACNNKTPIISNDTSLMHYGLLAAIGPDRLDLAEKTGKIIEDIVKKRIDPRSIKIEKARGVATIINLSVARKFGIKIPESTADIASEVIQ